MILKMLPRSKVAPFTFKPSQTEVVKTAQRRWVEKAANPQWRDSPQAL